jgi:site-specific DNA-methyltransferase (adenine-specific)
MVLHLVKVKLLYAQFKSVQIFEYTWNGMIQGDMINKAKIRIHPTQKPVALYKWLLDKYAKEKIKY